MEFGIIMMFRNPPQWYRPVAERSAGDVEGLSLRFTLPRESIKRALPPHSALPGFLPSGH